jgi:hypothetical protein
MQVQDSYYACWIWDTNQRAASGYSRMRDARQLLSPSCSWLEVI